MYSAKSNIDYFHEKINLYKSFDLYHEASEYYLLFDSYEMDSDRILFLSKVECILPFEITPHVDDAVALENKKDVPLDLWDGQLEHALESISSNSKIILSLHFVDKCTDEYIANFLSILVNDFNKFLRSAIREFIEYIPASIIEYLNEHVSRDKVYFLEDLPIQNNILRNVFIMALQDRKFPVKYTVDERLNAIIINTRFIYKNFVVMTDKVYSSSSSQEQIIEKLSQIFSSNIVYKILEKTIGNLSSFDSIINKVIEGFDSREVAIVKERFIEEKTLQEIANEYKLTRERVRQIESSIVRKMVRFIPLYVIHSVNDNVKILHICPVDKIAITDPFLRTLFVKLITHKDFSGHFIYDFEQDALISDKQFSFSSMRADIFKFIESIEATICQKDEMFSYIKYLYPMAEAEIIVDKLLTSGELIELDNQMVFIQCLYRSKRDKVEFVYSLYPNGFETNKNINLLKKELFYYFGNIFDDDSDRALTGFASLSDNILLWEWGKHIHIKFVEDILSNYDFTDLLKYIDQELENILAVDLDTYYNKNSMQLQLFGIPSKYALHTLVKLKYPDEYSFQDSPRIASLGTNRLELRQILVDVMSEPRSYEIEELMQKLNSPKNRIQQLIEHLHDIIAVDLFMYMKMEHIHIDDTLLKQIIQFVNEQVKAFKFIYIGLVVDHFREQLHSIAMHNKETTLLQLLQKYRGNKDFNVSNSRIVSKEYPITRQSLNFHYLVEQLMIDKKQISKNDIFNYFVERGLDPKHVMNYYNFSKFRSIVRINDELFVKMVTLGLNNEIIQAVTHLVEKHIKGEHHLSDLVNIVSEEIPLNEIAWNRFILCDILDKNLFRFTPSSDNPIYIEYKREPSETNEVYK